MKKVIDALTPICTAYGLDLIVEDPQAADHPSPFAPRRLGIDGSKTIVVSPECSRAEAAGAIHEIGHCIFDPVDNDLDAGAPEREWFAWEFLCACAADLVGPWSGQNIDYVVDAYGTKWVALTPPQQVQAVADMVRTFLTGPLAAAAEKLGHVDLSAGYRALCPTGDRLPPPRAAEANALSRELARNPHVREINALTPVAVAQPVQPVLQ